MTTSFVLPESLFYLLKQRAIDEDRSVSSVLRLILVHALTPDTGGA